MMTAKGFSFNKTFQVQHQKDKLPMPSGHWFEFCKALARDQAMKCKSCAHLRDRVLVPADQVAEAPEDQPPAAYSGRGRPPANVQAPTLQAWLAANRPNIYEHVRTTWYWCSICAEEKNFHRLGMSGKQFVIAHEQCEKHSRGTRSSGARALAGRPVECRGR